MSRGWYIAWRVVRVISPILFLAGLLVVTGNVVRVDKDGLGTAWEIILRSVQGSLIVVLFVIVAAGILFFFARLVIWSVDAFADLEDMWRERGG